MASFLIKDVRIFNGETTIQRDSVLVENGKITEVSEKPIEYDGKIISKPGHTLLPGLIDVHVHCDNANPVALPQALRFGVSRLPGPLRSYRILFLSSRSAVYYSLRHAQRVSKYREAPRTNQSWRLCRYQKHKLRSHDPRWLARGHRLDAQ